MSLDCPSGIIGRAASTSVIIRTNIQWQGEYSWQRHNAAAQDWRIPGGTILRRYCRGVVGFIGIGRKVFQRLVESHGVVERLNVPEHA